ncbi:helix-turn-helix domain-containing protein [Rhizobium sp. L245/93]|uniref:helix-turn-helix domain-containing protein n=1 Tax=Rhizobium sp. L245/93 TaxID=2819998 RepID=UPI001ADA2489|nr:helix-turn-helix domain-containing protein [Rhizobium sp. L245/93]MBO9168344.1 helix-turn-helix domain-containing protein [Rhizobium sp. L245/93]
MATPLKLDTHKFRKVRALMERGSTDGERDTARRKATEIAAKACMTLDAAIREDDRLLKLEDSKSPPPPPAQSAGPSWKDAFHEVFNSPEMEAQRAERNAKNAIKRDEVLKQYGSANAVFEPTPWEVSLRDAIEPFSQLNPYVCDITGENRVFTQRLDGEMAGDLLKGTDRARAAIASAIPMPTSIGAALAEAKAWDKLRRDRGLFFDSYAFGYNEESEVYVRRTMIEEYLAMAPVASWQDMEDRFAWKRHESEMEYLDPVERDDPFMDRIEEDFKILRAMADAQSQAPANPSGDTSGAQNGRAQNGRRTNADKAAEVQRMLIDEPGMSDRAIGRAVGVSPQTVTNWRNRLKASAAA